jgi:hypothetical protein
MAFYPLTGALIGSLLAALAFILVKTSLSETAPLLPAA